MSIRGAVRSMARFLNWRLIFSVAFLILVVTVAASVVNTSRAASSKDARIDQLIATIDDQQDAATSAEAEAAASRVRSSDERAQLLRQQSKLLRRSEQMADLLQTLIGFLSRSGVALPPDVVAQVQTQTSPKPPAETKVPQMPKPSASPKPTPSSAPTQAPTSQPSSVPTPAAPTPAPSVTPLLCVLGLCVP